MAAIYSATPKENPNAKGKTYLPGLTPLRQRKNPTPLRQTYLAILRYAICSATDVNKNPLNLMSLDTLERGSHAYSLDHANFRILRYQRHCELHEAKRTSTDTENLGRGHTNDIGTTSLNTVRYYLGTKGQLEEEKAAGKAAFKKNIARLPGGPGGAQPLPLRA